MAASRKSPVLMGGDMKPAMGLLLGIGACSAAALAVAAASSHTTESEDTDSEVKHGLFTAGSKTYTEEDYQKWEHNAEDLQRKMHAMAAAMEMEARRWHSAAERQREASNAQLSREKDRMQEEIQQLKERHDEVILDMKDKYEIDLDALRVSLRNIMSLGDNALERQKTAHAEELRQAVVEKEEEMRQQYETRLAEKEMELEAIMESNIELQQQKQEDAALIRKLQDEWRQIHEKEEHNEALAQLRQKHEFAKEEMERLHEEQFQTLQHKFENIEASRPLDSAEIENSYKDTDEISSSQEQIQHLKI